MPRVLAGVTGPGPEERRTDRPGGSRPAGAWGEGVAEEGGRRAQLAAA